MRLWLINLLRSAIWWPPLLSCVVVTTILPWCSQAEESHRPNIIFVLTDDQRADQLGFLNPEIETPSIDRLAAEGVHFANAFVTTSLCSPSRASILTGVYTSRHGVVDNFVPGVAPGLKFFPEYMQKAGYQTAFIGKWHMGHEIDDPRPGFDHWVSFAGQGSYFPTDMFGNESWLNVNGKQIRQRGYITDDLTDYAIDWLKQRDGSAPFFMYLSHKAIHAPFTPAPRHKSLYADRRNEQPQSQADTPENYHGKPMWVRNQRNYFHGVDFPFYTETSVQEMHLESDRAMAAIDESVGRILDQLDKIGQLENTLIIFTSDNGFMWGEHGLIDKRAAYEESIRVPMLAYFPRAFKAGTKVDNIVTNVDIAPTILAAAGITVPDHMQGRDFGPLARGKVVTDWPAELIYEYYWEWVFPLPPTTLAIRTDKYKLIRYHGVWDLDEFYNLEDDPGEMVNRIDDPEYQDLISQLGAKLHSRLTEFGGGRTVIPYTRKYGLGAALRNVNGPAAAEFPEHLLRSAEDPDRYEFLIKQMPDMAPNSDK